MKVKEKIMNDFIDPIGVCFLCGEVMAYPTEQQMEIFGRPECCDFDMLKVEREKIHTIVRALDTLRENLETELLKGIL